MTHKHKLILPDIKLNTEQEILERIASIRKQREIACDTPTKNNTSESWKKKQNRIKKLTEREGKMLIALKKIRTINQL